MRFSKKGKLIPHFIVPYQTFRRVGNGAYDLELLNELALIRPVIHVSMFKKYIGYTISVVPLEGLEMK